MLEFEKEGSDIKRSILKLEEATPLPNHGNRYRTVFKTRHGRQVFLSLERSGEDLIIENCRYLDRGQRRSNDSLVPKKLQTRRFPVDKLLAVIGSQLDKTFYGVEYGYPWRSTSNVRPAKPTGSTGFSSWSEKENLWMVFPSACGHG